MTFSRRSSSRYRRKSELLNRYADIYTKEMTRTALEKYFPEILRLLLTKLDKAPSETYKLRFVRLYHLVSSKSEAGLGTDFFVAQTDKVQQNIFTPLYLKTILPESQSHLVRPIDRKLAVVSFAKSLAESQAFGQRYPKGWRFTCETLLSILANAPQATAVVGDEVTVEADVDDIGFGLGFTALNTCRQPPRDDFPDIQDVPQWVRQYLTQVNAAKGGIIAGYVKERLSDEGKQALAMYLN